MAFRKKAEHIVVLKPDVAVVPECAERDASTLDDHGYAGVWVGSNCHKGLAVFVREPMRPIIASNPKHKWVVPVDITGCRRPFRVIAVWACKVGPLRAANYIGQVYRALKKSPEWLDSRYTIVAGDFNSNGAWDSVRPLGNHSAVVKILKERGIESAYHHYHKETPGAESRFTLYFRKDINNPSTLDQA